MNIIIMIMSKNGVETVKSVVIVNIIKLLDRPWPSAEAWCRLESPWGEEAEFFYWRIWFFKLKLVFPILLDSFRLPSSDYHTTTRVR